MEIIRNGVNLIGYAFFGGAAFVVASIGVGLGILAIRMLGGFKK